MVNVTNLDFDCFPTFVPSRSQTNGASLGASLLAVRFDANFELEAKAKIDELFNTDRKIDRNKLYSLVHIMDSGRVIAEGKLVGRFGSKPDGLILVFDSVEGAEHAAMAIRKSIAEVHPEELLQRHKNRSGVDGLGDYPPF